MHVASHQSVERLQQEVWLYLRQMELWKGLGSYDLLQLVHPKLSGCVVFAERALVSWPDLSIMSQYYYYNFLLPHLKVHRHYSNRLPIVVYISFARRPAPLSTRYTNRLNQGNTVGIRNVPLPTLGRGERNSCACDMSGRT